MIPSIISLAFIPYTPLGVYCEIYPLLGSNNKRVKFQYSIFLMIYCCTVLHCTELKYNAPNCTVLHCAALPHQTNITITFTFLNQFPLYFKNTNVWYYVLISFFIKKITFAFPKQTFAQTNYNFYEFMISRNNVIYFIYSILAHYIDV